MVVVRMASFCLFFAFAGAGLKHLTIPIQAGDQIRKGESKELSPFSFPGRPQTVRLLIIVAAGFLRADAIVKYQVPAQPAADREQRHPDCFQQ